MSTLPVPVSVSVPAEVITRDKSTIDILTAKPPECPFLSLAHEFRFDEDVDCIRCFVDVEYKLGLPIPKLSTAFYIYDDRGRYADKLGVNKMRSDDGSAAIIVDAWEVEVGGEIRSKNITTQCVKINLRKVDAGITSMLICLDGGPRCFNNVQGVSLRTRSSPGDRGEGSFLAGSGANVFIPLFNSTARTKKDCLDMVVCMIYKDGWDDEGKPKWAAMTFFEPLYQTITKAKEMYCSQVVINNVPCLEKCRPRLFPSVRGVCAALSSEALPKMKKFWKRAQEESLSIDEFTEVLFLQLYETHPRIINELEAGYAVAMIQEMFMQIDYNGDGGSDWNEFTTFLSLTGLSEQSSLSSGAGGEQQIGLNEYKIEYSEDPGRRDLILSTQKEIWIMRHFPEAQRIVVLPKDSDRLQMINEDFELIATLEATKLASMLVGDKAQTDSLPRSGHVLIPSAGDHEMKSIVYDVAYIPSRDLYAYACSDHSISIVKEKEGYGDLRRIYMLHNRIFHQLLHTRLCWSEAGEILCSVASDNVIYGWNLDEAQSIFQVSRHSELITDFIPVNDLGMFVSCAMDRRIVMWSVYNRRVKAVFTGHTRGVRTLSAYETTLLSGSFDCDCRTYDMATRENIGLLRGHRYPITAVTLMCARAAHEREHRAITVDESGEFRLWNIYVKERSSEAQQLPTLQTFTMQNPEPPLHKFRWLALPGNGRFYSANYEDFFALSSKLMHFIPVKNAKVFSPPAACIFHESSAFIVTAVAKELKKYDICTGIYVGAFPAVSPYDLTSVCQDGMRGRRLFCGNNKGTLYLLNFTDGSIIDELKVHSKEVSKIVCQRVGDATVIYTSSLDGSIVLTEEQGGKLVVRISIQQVFGPNSKVQQLEHAPSVRVILAASTKNYWGVWDDASLRKILVIRETSVVNVIKIVGASRDEEDLESLKTELLSMTSAQKKLREKEHLLTIAIALAYGVCLYTFDTFDIKGVHSFELLHKREIYVTDLVILRLPVAGCVNYSVTHAISQEMVGTQIVATTDDGHVVSWDGNGLRQRSEAHYRRTHKSVLSTSRAAAGTTTAPVSSKDTPHKQKPKLWQQQTPAKDNHQESDDNDTMSVAESVASSTPKGPGFLSKLNSSKNLGSGFSTPGFMTPGKLGKKKKENPEDALSLQEAVELKLAEGRMSISVFIHPINPPANPPTGTRRPALVESHYYGATVEKEMSNREWLAHNDSVTSLVELQEHGCFLTVSLDGFHRVWNIDTDCLGEMPLPNLADAMRKAPFHKRPFGGWKFVLERIPVTAKHEEIATRLSEMIRRDAHLVKKEEKAPQLRLPATSGSSMVNSDSVMSLPLLTHSRATLGPSGMTPSMYNIFTHHSSQAHLPTHLIPPSPSVSGVGGMTPGLGTGFDDDFIEEDNEEGSEGEGIAGLGPQGESQGMSLQVGERALDEADGEVMESEHDQFRAYLVRSLGEAPVKVDEDTKPDKIYTKKELSELRFRRTDRQQQARSLSPPPNLRGMMLGGDLDASLTLADNNNHSPSRGHSPTRGGNNSNGHGTGTGLGHNSTVRFGPSSNAQESGPTPTRSLTRPGTANNRLPSTTTTNRPQTAHAGERATRGTITKTTPGRPPSSGPSPTSTPVKSSLPTTTNGTTKPSTTPGRPPLAPGTISVSASTSHLPSPSPSQPSSSSNLSLLQQQPRASGNTTLPRPNTAMGITRITRPSPTGRTSPGPLANKNSEETTHEQESSHPSSNRSPLHSRAPSPINAHPGASPGLASKAQPSQTDPEGVAKSPSLSRTLARPSTASSYLGRSNNDRDHMPTENYRISVVSGGRTTESTWLAPEELGEANKGYKINFKLTKAFTENSLVFSEYIPRVEEEPLKMLRAIAEGGPAKIQVYENNQPRLLLRSPARSTSIQVPTLAEVKADEAIFGSQNDLYKNAKKHINSSGSISSKMSPHTIRHSVVCARIQANVRKVNTMLHVINKANENSLMADKYDLSSDDSDEEKDDDGDQEKHYHYKGTSGTHSTLRPPSAFIGIGGRSVVTHANDVLTLGGYLGNVGEGWNREEEYQTRFRLHKSASMMTADAARRLFLGPQQPNKTAIQKLIEKVDACVDEEAELVADYESRMHASRPSKTKVVTATSKATLEALEAKLSERIRFVLAWVTVKKETVYQPPPSPILTLDSPMPSKKGKGDRNSLDKSDRKSFDVASPLPVGIGKGKSIRPSFDTPKHRSSPNVSNKSLTHSQRSTGNTNLLSPLKGNRPGSSTGSRASSQRDPTLTKIPTPPPSETLPTIEDTLDKAKAAMESELLENDEDKPPNLGSQLLDHQNYSMSSVLSLSRDETQSSKGFAQAFLSQKSNDSVLSNSRRYDNDEDDTVGELGLHTLTREMSSLDPTPSVSSRALSLRDDPEPSTTTPTQVSSSDHPHLTIDPLTEPVATETEPISAIETLPLSNNTNDTPIRRGSTKSTARGPHTSLAHPPDNNNDKDKSLKIQKNGKDFVLTTRMLLPWYKVDDVAHFCEIFSFADLDFMGDLDIDEWCMLFTRLDKNTSVQHARLLFMKVDRNASGALSLAELIPFIFDKATPHQVKLISEYCTVILVKDKISEEPTFSPSEAEQLFDAYDEENVNFIIVGKVRDRCRQCYHLPEAIQHHFIQPIEAIDDDEMFNRIEFNRFLKPYITVEKKDKYGVTKAIK